MKLAENLTGALALGYSLCWDESIGYLWGSDYPNTADIDCSNFIGYCLAQNGFNVNPRWTTGSMITTLLNYTGFSHFIFDGDVTTLRHGDILVYDEPSTNEGHTFFYVENFYGYTGTDWHTATNSKAVLPRGRMEASGVHNHPETGDQDNGYGAHTEVWVHPWGFSSDGHTWHVFRWHDSPTPPTTDDDFIILSRWIKKRRSQL